MEFYTIFVIFRSMKLVVLLADISWDCVETLSDLFIQVLEYCPQIQQKIRLFTMEMWCKFQRFIIYSYNRRNYIGYIRTIYELILIFTSSNKAEVMWSFCLSVCLSFCEQDYWKSDEPISLKLSVMIGPFGQSNPLKSSLTSSCCFVKCLKQRTSWGFCRASQNRD